MTARVQHMKDCCLVIAKGGFDAEDCLLLENVIRNASLSQNKSVWVDCEHLTSISTESLRKLIAIETKAEIEGVTLLFYQLSTEVNKILKKTRLDNILHIFPTLADAYHYTRQQKKQY